jgi:hypothetical protein
MSSNLWLSNSTHRVFGWNDILQRWTVSYDLPLEVKRVCDNLTAAMDPDGTHNPSVSQFLAYLNYEQEGIAWFLFECITMRWMYSSVRLDYVRSLVDEIENLDAPFPRFPGSPTGLTIREFVEQNLNPSELAAVEMMPPLVQEWSYQTPARVAGSPLRSARAAYSYAQRAPAAPRRAPVAPAAAADAYPSPRVSRTLSQQFESLQTPKEKKLPIQIRCLRTAVNKGNDDVINITKKSDDSYSITYFDQEALVKSKTQNVDRAGVVNFLSMTLRLLTVDEEPFHSVQFTLPSMPTIMVSPENLSSQTRDLIYDSVEATMNNWPAYVRS